MEIEESIIRAERVNKPHFANRLRMMIEKKLEKKLEEFTIKTKIFEIKGNVLEEMFKIFGSLCSIYNHDNLIVNVATGDRMTTCAALSASYANGLKAFGVMEDKTILFRFPV